MEKRKTDYAILTILVLGFMALIINSVSSLEIEWQRQPDSQELSAFRDLAGITDSPTAWPIYKIGNNQIVVDGLLDEPSWKKARSMYTTGEWFWNDKATSMPWLYSSYKDFIAIWRVLYDSSNMYISCEFFDDIHSIGKDLDPWNKVDGIEVTIVFPTQTVTPMLTVPEKKIRIWRRFTEKGGLIGMIDSIRIPGPIITSGWRETVEEGSSKLGGIYCAAKPLPESDSRVLKNYPGAYVIEMKLPLHGSDVKLPRIIENVAFKMNLKLFDLDSSSVALTKDNSLPIGMNRFTPPWWNDMVKLNEAAYYPTFFFTEINGVDEKPKYPLPDEFNLYCGKTGAFYDSIIVNPSETNVDEFAITSGRNVFGIRSIAPSPLDKSGVISFVLDKSGNASLHIFDLSGTLIASAADGFYNAGINTVPFSCLGKALPGNYILRLETGSRSFTKKISVLH